MTDIDGPVADLEPVTCVYVSGSRIPDGYGLGGVAIGGGRYSILQHRMAFEQHWGPIPSGMCVMHTCDNPPCVNPLHLRLGTHAENMRDMAQKRRSKNGNTRLSAEDVSEIRAVYKPWSRTHGARALGVRFGVRGDTIQKIAYGERWKR